MSRAMEILGAAAVATSGGASTALAPMESSALSASKPSLGDSVKYRVAPSVGAGAAGALLWKKHPVLGMFAGVAVGVNAYDLVKGGDGHGRTKALCDMGQTVAAIAGSLYWKKHPVWGFIAGSMVGSAAASFVPGSRASESFKSLNK